MSTKSNQRRRTLGVVHDNTSTTAATNTGGRKVSNQETYHHDERTMHNALASIVEGEEEEDDNNKKNSTTNSTKTGRSSSLMSRRMTLAAPRITSSTASTSTSSAQGAKKGQSDNTGEPITLQNTSTTSIMDNSPASTVTNTRSHHRRKSSIGVHNTTSGGRPSMGSQLATVSTAASISSIPTDEGTITTQALSIQDKTYFHSCIKTLVTYLNTHGFYNNTSLTANGNHWYTIFLKHHNHHSNAIQPPSTTAQKNSSKDQPCPSSKEFLQIVAFLLRKVDSSLLASIVTPTGAATSSTITAAGTTNTTTTTAVKVEEEILFTFKILGYPHNISKTTLAAAGSTHTWPTLVQALAWFVQVLEYYEYGHTLEKQQETVQVQEDEIWLLDVLTATTNITTLPGQDERDHHPTTTTDNNNNLLVWLSSIKDNTHPKYNILLTSVQESMIYILNRHAQDAFVQFLLKAYPLFLLQQDEVVESLESSMVVEKIEQGSDIMERIMTDLVQLNATLLERLNHLNESVQDLSLCQQRLKDLLVDSERFNYLVSQYEENISSLKSKINEREKELQDKTLTQEGLVERIRFLKEAIQKQGMTVDMARTMEAECIQAEKSLEQVRTLKNEHKNSTHQNEMERNKLMTSLDSILSGFKEQFIQLWSGDDSILTTMNNTNSSLHLSNVVQMKLKRDAVHEDDPKVWLGGIAWKDISDHLFKTKALYTEKSAQLRRDKLTWMTRQETSDEILKEHQDALDIVLASRKRWEDTLQRETEEQEAALAMRRKDLNALEESIRYLRDPIDMESDFSTLQIRHSHLLALRREKENERAVKKRAILQEMNEALRLCAEHRQFQSAKLNELNEDLSAKLNRRSDPGSIYLSTEQERVLQSSEV